MSIEDRILKDLANLSMCFTPIKDCKRIDFKIGNYCNVNDNFSIFYKNKIKDET